MTRPALRRTSALRALAGASVLAAAITVSVPAAAEAAVACNETALVAAINAANAAGGGNVVLTPLCTYDLTASHATGTHGPDGLPIITTVVTLTGNQNTITRSTGALVPTFRIAEVSMTGALTLKSVTFSNGSVLGSGGGILNYGAVTLTGSALTGNAALLGTGGGLSNADVAAPAHGPAATFTSSLVAGNTATGMGAGLYNGLRGTLTATSTSITTNASLARGGGIAAVNSTATTLTSTPVGANSAIGGAGGVYRSGGIMTITTSPITRNTPNNCVGSSPTVPGCIG